MRQVGHLSSPPPPITSTLFLFLLFVPNVVNDRVGSSGINRYAHISTYVEIFQIRNKYYSIPSRWERELNLPSIASHMRVPARFQGWSTCSFGKKKTKKLWNKCAFSVTTNNNSIRQMSIVINRWCRPWNNRIRGWWGGDWRGKEKNLYGERGVVESWLS